MKYSTIALIKSDLSRICDPSFKNFLRWYFFPQGTTFPYLFWYRLCARMKRNCILKYTLGVICYMFYRHMGFKYGISIDTGIEVGPELLIVHGGSVYLNCQKIGSHCTFYQTVTLGSDTRNEIPIIKNNVTVYTGAVVVGNIEVGDNAIIGCNSYVHRNVDENAIVAGNPARKIS